MSMVLMTCGVAVVSGVSAQAHVKGTSVRRRISNQSLSVLVIFG